MLLKAEVARLVSAAQGSATDVEVKADESAGGHRLRKHGPAETGKDQAQFGLESRKCVWFFFF